MIPFKRTGTKRVSTKEVWTVRVDSVFGKPSQEGPKGLIVLVGSEK